MADKWRRKKEPRHIRLYHSITGTEAWRHLSGNGIKVLIALARFDDGGSNGELYFSERTAAAQTGLSRNTVRRALRELIDKGFIAQTKSGAFNRNNLLAATYLPADLGCMAGRQAARTDARFREVETKFSGAEFDGLRRRFCPTRGNRPP